MKIYSNRSGDSFFLFYFFEKYILKFKKLDDIKDFYSEDLCNNVGFAIIDFNKNAYYYFYNLKFDFISVFLKKQKEIFPLENYKINDGAVYEVNDKRLIILNNKRNYALVFENELFFKNYYQDVVVS